MIKTLVLISVNVLRRKYTFTEFNVEGIKNPETGFYDSYKTSEGHQIHYKELGKLTRYKNNLQIICDKSLCTWTKEGSLDILIYSEFELKIIKYWKKFKKYFKRELK